MKNLLFFVFLTVISSSALGQNDIWMRGYVSDPSNNPLVNAYVSDDRGVMIASVDHEGMFIIELKERITEIHISFIGFQTLDVSIDVRKLDFSNGIALQEFTLIQDIQQIDKVSISSDRIKLAYEKPEILIYDFVFHGDNILLYLKEDQERKLRLINNASKTILDTTIAIKKGEFFHSCTGDLLFIDKESCYSIEIEENIQIERECSIEQFNELIKPCETMTPGFLFTSKFGPHNKSLRYQGTNVQTGDSEVIADIIEFKALKAAGFHFERMKTMGGVNPAGELDIKALGRTRELFQDQAYYKFIMTKPLFAPLLNINNNIYIFDHVNSYINHYDYRGKFKFSIDMMYSENMDKVTQIIKDETLNEVYAVSLRGGLAHLSKIDPYTGESIQEIRLDKHTFPERIKIRNGIAYYIYQRKDDLTVPNIFKQSL